MIDQAQSEEKSRLKKDKSREAISLALEGRWDGAIEVNREILRVFPADVESLNRLGKALLELGRYSEARDAFTDAVKLAPYNSISKKNLERLTHLQEAEPAPKQGKVVTPHLFIEQSGKSEITQLQRPAPQVALAKMAAGDPVDLKQREKALTVETNRGEYLGQVGPRLGMRLARLMDRGNRYQAAIISVNHQDISIIVYETYRHPEAGSMHSFSTRSGPGDKVYWKDPLAGLETESQMDEDEEFAPAWSGNARLSDGEELSEAPYAGKPAEEGERYDE